MVHNMERIKERKILENANDFLYVANRCSFTKRNITQGNLPLLVPEVVNRSFACELYLKAIAQATNIKPKNTHNLDKLFYALKENERKAIYDIWRENAGKNIIDCDYVQKMFKDNLTSIADKFVKWRYVYEWCGSSIKISGFINQFAISLKIFAEQVIGKTYNS